MRSHEGDHSNKNEMSRRGLLKAALGIGAAAALAGCGTAEAKKGKNLPNVSAESPSATKTPTPEATPTPKLPEKYEGIYDMTSFRERGIKYHDFVAEMYDTDKTSDELRDIYGEKQTEIMDNTHNAVLAQEWDTFSEKEQALRVFNYLELNMTDNSNMVAKTPEEGEKMGDSLGWTMNIEDLSKERLEQLSHEEWLTLIKKDETIRRFVEVALLTSTMTSNDPDEADLFYERVRKVAYRVDRDDPAFKFDPTTEDAGKQVTQYDVDTFIKKSRAGEYGPQNGYNTYSGMDNGYGLKFIGPSMWLGENKPAHFYTYSVHSVPTTDASINVPSFIIGAGLQSDT